MLLALTVAFLGDLSFLVFFILDLPRLYISGFALVYHFISLVALAPRFIILALFKFSFAIAILQAF